MASDHPESVAILDSGTEVAPETVLAHLLLSGDFARTRLEELAERIGVPYRHIQRAIRELAKSNRVTVQQGTAAYVAAGRIVQRVLRVILDQVPEDGDVANDQMIRGDLDGLEESLARWIMERPGEATLPGSEVESQAFRGTRRAALDARVAAAPHLRQVGLQEFENLVHALVTLDQRKAPVTARQLAKALGASPLSKRAEAIEAGIRQILDGSAARGRFHSVTVRGEPARLPRGEDILPTSAVAFLVLYRSAARAEWELLQGHLAGRHAGCCAVHPAPFLLALAPVPPKGLAQDDLVKMFEVEVRTVRLAIEHLAEHGLATAWTDRAPSAHVSLAENHPLRFIAAVAELGAAGATPDALATKMEPLLDALLPPRNQPHRQPQLQEIVERLADHHFFTDSVPPVIRPIGWYAAGLCPGCAKPLSRRVAARRSGERGRLQLPVCHADCPMPESDGTYGFEAPACRGCGGRVSEEVLTTVRDLLESSRLNAPRSKRPMHSNRILDLVEEAEHRLAFMPRTLAGPPARLVLDGARRDLESIGLGQGSALDRIPEAAAALAAAMGNSPAAPHDVEAWKSAGADLIHWAFKAKQTDAGPIATFGLEREHAFHEHCLNRSTSALRKPV